MLPQMMKHVRGGRDESPFLFAFRLGPYYLAMLYAYFDESGHPADSPVVSVAVVVSTEEGWHAFNDEWNSLLKHYEIRGLHMKEYAHSRGAFSGWKGQDLKRDQFIGDLASLLINHIRFGYVCSVPMADWNEVMLDKLHPNIQKRGPLIFLLRCCLDAINETDLLPKDEKIACVFEHNDFWRGAAEFHFKDWTVEWGLEERFGKLLFDEKYEHAGLQGADMLAYEGRKFIVTHYAQPDGRPERKLHRILTSSPNIEADFFERDGLRSYLRTNYPDFSTDAEAQP